MAMGRTIREARLAKGMSLGQLAAAVGRSSASVRRWERGEVAPAIGIIDDLARVLDIDAEELRSQSQSGGEPAVPPPSNSRLDADVAGGNKPSTLEPDAVSPAQPTARTGETTAVPARSSGIIADAVEAVRHATSGWGGWIRGLLTAVILIVMALVLVWALGQLASALGEIWDSFDTGSTG
mgnify:FL=1